MKKTKEIKFELPKDLKEELRLILEINENEKYKKLFEDLSKFINLK